MGKEERVVTALKKSKARPKPTVSPLAYDITTAATVLGIGVTKLWGLIREGEIRPVRLGKRTLITVREIERVLSQDASDDR
tara:strand:- start:1825 stop:2067 length:243 start_codon:yes stop_codon:yes gene_type:complete